LSDFSYELFGIILLERQKKMKIFALFRNTTTKKVFITLVVVGIIALLAQNPFLFLMPQSHNAPKYAVIYDQPHSATKNAVTNDQPHSATKKFNYLPSKM